MTPLTRRAFLGAAAAGLASAAFAQERASGGLRTITYNVLGCRGYPETLANRNRLEAARPRMPERIALELALYDPDIVTLQEGPPEDAVAVMAAELDRAYAFFPGGWEGNDRYPGGFPGAVLSRFPIIEWRNAPISGDGPRPDDLFTRHLGYAALEAPRGALHVFSAHLHPNDRAVRLREIETLLALVQPILDRKEPVLVQGDFNHRPGSPEYRRWQRAGLRDVFAAVGAGPGETFPSTKPGRRIDYVWAGGPLAARVATSRVLNEGGFRRNPDDPASFALSDHLPLLAEFE